MAGRLCGGDLRARHGAEGSSAGGWLPRVGEIGSLQRWTTPASGPVTMAGVKGVGLAAATAALGAAAVTEAVARAYDRPPTAIAALIALAVVAPVALVRLWPATAAVLSALAALSGLMISYPVTIAGV